jgi:hypothetical protein
MNRWPFFANNFSAKQIFSSTCALTTGCPERGEFSPIGWLFSLGGVLKFSEVVQMFGLFSHGTSSV